MLNPKINNHSRFEKREMAMLLLKSINGSLFRRREVMVKSESNDGIVKASVPKAAPLNAWVTDGRPTKKIKEQPMELRREMYARSLNLPGKANFLKKL